jgi:transposase-like protein
LVSHYKSSGQSQTDFAASHGLSKSKFNYWLTKLSKSEKVLPLANKPTFVPVETTPSHSKKANQVIVIRLSNGVEIEIPL